MSGIFTGFPKYPITAKADIYPYGLVLYEMLSLKTPHIPTSDSDESISGTDTTVDMDNFDDSAFEEALQEAIGKPLFLITYFLTQSSAYFREIFLNVN